MSLKEQLHIQTKSQSSTHEATLSTSVHEAANTQSTSTDASADEQVLLLDENELDKVAGGARSTRYHRQTSTSS